MLRKFKLSLMAVLLAVLVLAGIGNFTFSGDIAKAGGCENNKNCFIETGVEPKEKTKAKCSRNACDHLDPYSMGCNVDYGVVAMAYITDSKGQRIGYVQLWYSNTCKTNWARVVRTTNLAYKASSVIYRDDNKNGTFGVGDTLSLVGATSNSTTHSPMLYAPNTPAKASGDLGVYRSFTIWR